MRALLVWDSASDADLVVSELERQGYAVEWRRVDTADLMRSALAEGAWDIVLCDHALSRFSCREALATARANDDDVPFLVIADAMTLRHLPRVMHAGSHDYLSKDRLERLGAAIEQETSRVRERKARQREEEALRTAYDGYQSILATTLDGFWLVSGDGRLIDVNPAYVRQSGYSREELLGMRISDLEAKESAAQTAEHIQRIIESGGDQFESVHRRKDGSTWIVEVSTTYRQAGGGQFFVFLRDITSRKRAEEELREAHVDLELRVKERTAELVRMNDALQAEIADRKRAEAQLQLSQARIELALKGADLAAWDWNIQSGEVVFSSRWAEMRGFDPEEIPAHVDPWLEGVHPDDRPRVQRALLECCEGRAPLYASEHRVSTKSGEWLWVADRGKVFERDENGQPVRMAGTVRDISESKRAEESLRKLSRAVEQTGDAVILTDRNGVIEYVNPAFEQTTGFRLVDAIGATPKLINSGEHDGRFYQSLWETILSGKVFRAVITNKTKDGRVYYDEQTITPLRDSRGIITNFVATGRDITRSKQTEKALRRLNDRLECEATRIAASLHDGAGQCLTAAHIALAEVARQLPPASRDCLEDVRRNLDDVEEELRRLAHELHPRILDDLGLVEAIRFLGDGVARRTGIPVRVEVSLEGRCAPLVETALYRMVQEGLTNIMKHAGATQVSIVIEQDGQNVRCLVKDDGPGFDVAAATARQEPGLGLAGMQDRLVAVNGVLEIISAPGKGTELCAIVPREI